MSHWLSLPKVLTIALLGFAGFASIRSGWIPIEFGGTETGSIIDANNPRGSTDDTGALPEFESDESDVPLDIGGIPADVLSQQTEPLSEDALLVVPERRSSDGRRTLPSTELRLVSDEQPANAEPLTEIPTVKSAEAPTEAAEPPAIDSLDEPPVRIAKRPNDNASAIDLTGIDRQFKNGQLIEAHRALSKIYWQQPEQRSRLQERIDTSANAIYFSPQPHVQPPYVVQPGDQLRKIAAKHHVPWQFLAKLNRTDPRRLREGQKLKVIDGPFGAVVTLSDFELVVHHQGQYVRGYRVCIGKNGSSPVGKFQVGNKVTNPQYTDPDGKVFAGDNPKNPLGKFWLDLGDSYGIHGTIEPDSIGKAESRGCIRMLNEDVAEVYDILDVGSEVVIRK